MSECDGRCPMCCMEEHPPPVPEQQRAAAWALGLVFGLEMCRDAIRRPEGDAIPVMAACKKHAILLHTVAEAHGMSGPVPISAADSTSVH